MKRAIWKLSDTVAAVFFGMWFFSMLFRPFFGGLDVVVSIVAAVWGLSVWARTTHGEYVQPELAKEQKENLERLRDWNNDLLTNPAYDNLPSNANFKHDD